MYSNWSKLVFPRNGNPAGRIFLMIVLLFGVYLRCWNWTSQVLLDDEWHALNFVLSRSFMDVVLQQGLGANSIPINIWTWLLLHTIGWSEALLKLPSLVCSIIALFLLPWLVKRLWGEAVATVTAALLAVSPVVIFYSRLTRPYAPTMLLAAVSLLCTLLWLKSGTRRELLISAVCGALAIYFHLYAAIPVCSPLLVAAFYCLMGKMPMDGDSHSKNKYDKVKDLFIAFLIFVVVDGALVVIPNLLNPWWRSVQGIDHATLETVRTVMTLLAGSRSLVLGIMTTILVVVGLSLMIRESRIIGLAFMFPFVIFLGVASTTTQDGSHAGIQIARYGISFFPLSFIAVAYAVVKFGEVLRKILRPAISGYSLPFAGIILWIPFLATNPLWQIYTSPNNFTNHSCYEYRYEPIQWEIASPERDLMPGVYLPYSEIPRCYFNRRIFSDAKGVIEYPMLVGDQNNLFYYYQHFHKLPVVIGYNLSFQMPESTIDREYVPGDSPIEYVLSSVPANLQNRSTWRTMVDLQDIEMLKKHYPGWLIVVHFNPLRELANDNRHDMLPSTVTSEYLLGKLGAPVFVEGDTIVWQIH